MKRLGQNQISGEPRFRVRLQCQAAARSLDISRGYTALRMVALTARTPPAGPFQDGSRMAFGSLRFVRDPIMMWQFQFFFFQNNPRNDKTQK